MHNRNIHYHQLQILALQCVEQLTFEKDLDWNKIRFYDKAAPLPFPKVNWVLVWTLNYRWSVVFADSCFCFQDFLFWIFWGSLLLDIVGTAGGVLKRGWTHSSFFQKAQDDIWKQIWHPLTLWSIPRWYCNWFGGQSLAQSTAKHWHQRHYSRLSQLQGELHFRSLCNPAQCTRQVIGLASFTSFKSGSPS